MVCTSIAKKKKLEGLKNTVAIVDTLAGKIKLAIIITFAKKSFKNIFDVQLKNFSCVFRAWVTLRIHSGFSCRLFLNPSGEIRFLNVSI